jgi:two-component system chemotaxis response regulator CheY
MNKTIMTVDDSVSVRMMVGFALKDAGYEIVEAVNGLDALSKLDEHDIKMVVADVNMPEMDGIEFVRKMRQHPKHKFTPVVMLTTESHESIKEKGKEAGATGWIVKPFKPAQLLSVVRKVLG